MFMNSNACVPNLAGPSAVIVMVPMAAILTARGPGLDGNVLCVRAEHLGSQYETFEFTFEATS